MRTHGSIVHGNYFNGQHRSPHSEYKVLIGLGSKCQCSPKLKTVSNKTIWRQNSVKFPQSNPKFGVLERITPLHTDLTSNGQCKTVDDCFLQLSCWSMFSLVNHGDSSINKMCFFCHKVYAWGGGWKACVQPFSLSPSVTSVLICLEELVCFPPFQNNCSGQWCQLPEEASWGYGVDCSALHMKNYVKAQICCTVFAMLCNSLIPLEVTSDFKPLNDNHTS